MDSGAHPHPPPSLSLTSRGIVAFACGDGEALFQRRNLSGAAGHLGVNPRPELLPERLLNRLELREAFQGRKKGRGVLARNKHKNRCDDGDDE